MNETLPGQYILYFYQNPLLILGNPCKVLTSNVLHNLPIKTEVVVKKSNIPNAIIDIKSTGRRMKYSMTEEAVFMLYYDRSMR